MKLQANTILMTAIAVAFASCSNDKAANTDSAKYKTEQMVPVSRTLSIPYSATLRGNSDVKIYPQVSGMIKRLLVEEGQEVRKGQLLFVIDQVSYQAALHKAEANVEAALAAVSTEQITYNGQKILHDKNIISDVAFRTSANDLKTSKAQLALRQAELEEARNNLSYTEIRSPTDGVIDVLPFREGALVSPNMGEPLTTVSDNATMYAYFSLTENQMLAMVREYGSMRNAITKLPTLELRLGDNSIYKEEGRIETISGMIDSHTGTVSVRAAFSNKGGLLHSGGSADVIVPVEYDRCIVIPRSATYEIQYLTYAYKVIGGKAQATIIEVERANANEYIVHKGLQFGDIVVTEGIKNLRDGMEIKS